MKLRDLMLERQIDVRMRYEWDRAKFERNERSDRRFHQRLPLTGLLGRASELTVMAEQVVS